MSVTTDVHGIQMPILPRPYSYIKYLPSQETTVSHAIIRNTVTDEILFGQFLHGIQLDETNRWLLQLDAQYICMLQHANLLSHRAIYYDVTSSTVVILVEIPGQSLLSFYTERYATLSTPPPECILWRIIAQTLSVYHYLQTQEISLCMPAATKYHCYVTPTMESTYVSDSSSSFSIKLSFVGATHSGLDYSIIQPEDLPFRQPISADKSEHFSFTRRTNVILSLKALGLFVYNVISFGVSKQLCTDLLPQETIESILKSERFKGYTPEFHKIFSFLVSPGLYIQENTVSITHSDIDLLSFLSHPMILSALTNSDNVKLQLGLQFFKKLYSRVKHSAKRWLVRKGLIDAENFDDSIAIKTKQSKLVDNNSPRQRKEKGQKMRVSFHTDLSVQNYDKNSFIDSNIVLTVPDKSVTSPTDFVLSTNITSTDNTNMHNLLKPSVHNINSTSSTGYFLISKKCDWRQCFCELKKGHLKPYKYTRVFVNTRQLTKEDVLFNSNKSTQDNSMEETTFFISPLILAALSNNVEEILRYAPKYAGIRSGRDGMTALMFAAEAGNVEATLELLKYEACLRTTNFATAMMLAVAADQTETAKCLVEYEHGSTDKTLRTALRIAIDRDNLDMVFHLAKYESEISDIDNYTPIMCAIEQRKHDVAKLLITYASRCQTTDRHKKTALILALEHDYLDIAEYLIPIDSGLQDGNGTTALMVAIERGHVDIATKLISEEQGLCDKKGRTALMYAAKRGMHRLVQKLVETEARKQDVKGITALMVAVAKQNIELIDILARYEAGITDNEGNYAISIATYKKNLEIISILLEHEGKYLSHEALLNLLKEFQSSDIQILLQLSTFLRKHSSHFSLVRYASSHCLYDLCSQIFHYPQLISRHDHLYLITCLERIDKDTEGVWNDYLTAVNANQTFRIDYLIMNARLKNEKLHKYIDERASGLLRFKMFLEHTVAASIGKEFEPLERYCSSMPVSSKYKCKKKYRAPMNLIDNISFIDVVEFSNSSDIIQSPMSFIKPDHSESIRPGEFPVTKLSNLLAYALIDFLLEYATAPDGSISSLSKIYDGAHNNTLELLDVFLAHNLCYYCHVKPISLVYWPCRHLYACCDCAKNAKRRHCIICGETIEGGIPLTDHGDA